MGILWAHTGTIGCIGLRYVIIKLSLRLQTLTLLQDLPPMKKLGLPEQKNPSPIVRSSHSHHLRHTLHPQSTLPQRAAVTYHHRTLSPSKMAHYSPAVIHRCQPTLNTLQQTVLLRGCNCMFSAPSWVIVCR